MTSIPTRACCIVLSTLSAAALVAFVDPASAVGTAHPATPTAVVASTAPIATAQHG